MNSSRRQFHHALLLTAFLIAITLHTATTAHAAETKVLRLATTTSVDNTGLLKAILPVFEKANNARIDVIAVGTGKAIEIARNGDVDAILVHDPDLEAKFMADGFGTKRTTLMWNDFIVVGPPSDPAKIRGGKVATACFTAIADKRQPFISRGDKSGTNNKELKLWAQAGIKPSGQPWYIEGGRGMEATLLMADEKQGYTLTDRGTFIATLPKLRLKVLCEGDKDFINIYSIIPVNPAKYPNANNALAEKLARWLASPQGQKLIADFRASDTQLFHLFTEKKATPAPPAKKGKKAKK